MYSTAPSDWVITVYTGEDLDKTSQILCMSWQQENCSPVCHRSSKLSSSFEFRFFFIYLSEAGCIIETKNAILLYPHVTYSRLGMMDSFLSQEDLREVKRKKSHLGFELSSSSALPHGDNRYLTITGMHLSIYLSIYRSQFPHIYLSISISLSLSLYIYIYI